ncbi:MAG TPA: hypothetical protein VFZ66_01225 [Herpetosiphonaceae bacterium]
MRNMRGALWALGLAGAAYAWKNRNQLSQQFNSMTGNRFGRHPSQSFSPQELPDTSRSEQRDFDTYSKPSSFNERELGGTSL